jgi:hypothetical protein
VCVTIQVTEMQLLFAVADLHHNTVFRAVTIYLFFLRKRNSPVALAHEGFEVLSKVTMRCLLFAGCMAYSSAPKTEAVCSSEMLGNFYRTTRRQVPEDSNI